MIKDFELAYFKKLLPKYNLDDNTGIVTGADSNVFMGLQVLFTSISSNANFICYDLGLTESQKQWCRNVNLQLQTAPNFPFNKDINGWQTYAKPWLINSSPFKYTVWIDTDCIVLGNLEEASLIKERQSFVVSHWVRPSNVSHNLQSLYQRYPTNTEKRIRINGGVIGINKKDQNILTDWIYLLTEASKDHELLSLITSWDEGALEWSLEKNKAFSLITEDFRYNLYTGVGRSKYKDISCKPNLIINPSAFPITFFKEISNFASKHFISHFATCMQAETKYWKMWLQQ